MLFCCRCLFLSLMFFGQCSLAAVPEVAVDVGHGLKDSGAISARGKPEFEFNQLLARHLAQALQNHQLRVREINFDGSIRKLAERPARALGSDLLVSIHHDSIDEQYLQNWTWNGVPASYTDVKQGYGLFISARNPFPDISLRCAVVMGLMLRRAGFEPSTWHGKSHLAADAQNGVWYYDNLVVLHAARMPALLFEAGVIKHRDEELALLDPLRQARMADALATGSAACLSVR
jgi:N-acetylmuramoyl-L-alanine amidase